MPLPKFNQTSYAHFITTKTNKNYLYFNDDKCCQILSDNIIFYRNKYSFDLLAWVIMPDHLHMIIWWDVDDNPDLTISKIIHGIKNHSAKQILNYMGRRGPLTSPELRLGQGTQSTRSEYPHRRMDFMTSIFIPRINYSKN